MSKRTLSASRLGATKKPSIGSSAERSEIQVPLICKGTSAFEEGVLSFMFGISSQTGAILRAQEVLLDRIESIALKVEILQKEVQSMKEDCQRIETKSPERSWLPSDEVIRGWLSSPIPSPTHGSTMDLTCSEMPFISEPQSSDPIYWYDGSMELPEWGSLD